MPASILSVNGKLMSLYDSASVEEPRSAGYNTVEIGKPLIIQFLYFYLKHPHPEKKNEIMVSTFVKTKETKEASAEAVNYFDNTLEFNRKTKDLRICDFGAQRYGHRLIYYTKSYLGESVSMTAKIMELDKTNKKLIESIKNGLGAVASLPIFAEFLPYTAGASIGVSIFTKIFDLFNKDDALIKGHDIDLQFNLPNVRRLQSGRIVCIPDKEEEFFIGGGFELSQDNQLIKSDTNEEYTGSSYFVIQIDSKENKPLENFDYLVGAAALLSLTNRPGNPTEIVETFVDIYKGYNDIKTIQDIEELSFEVDSDETKKKMTALYKSMTNVGKALYKDRMKAITEQIC